MNNKNMDKKTLKQLKELSKESYKEGRKLLILSYEPSGNTLLIDCLAYFLIVVPLMVFFYLNSIFIAVPLFVVYLTGKPKRIAKYISRHWHLIYNQQEKCRLIRNKIKFNINNLSYSNNHW